MALGISATSLYRCDEVAHISNDDTVSSIANTGQPRNSVRGHVPLITLDASVLLADRQDKDASEAIADDQPIAVGVSIG